MCVYNMFFFFMFMMILIIFGFFYNVTSLNLVKFRNFNLELVKIEFYKLGIVLGVLLI